MDTYKYDSDKVLYIVYYSAGQCERIFFQGTYFELV